MSTLSLSQCEPPIIETSRRSGLLLFGYPSIAVSATRGSFPPLRSRPLWWIPWMTEIETFRPLSQTAPFPWIMAIRRDRTPFKFVFVSAVRPSILALVVYIDRPLLRCPFLSDPTSAAFSPWFCGSLLGQGCLRSLASGLLSPFLLRGSCPSLLACRLCDR